MSEIEKEFEADLKEMAHEIGWDELLRMVTRLKDNDNH